MSLQARVRGGGDWYHPDRDLAYNFHLWLRNALINVHERHGHDVGNNVRLTETASRLARVVADCTAGRVTDAQLADVLCQMDQAALGLIGKEFLCHVFSMYRAVRQDELPIPK